MKKSSMAVMTRGALMALLAMGWGLAGRAETPFSGEISEDTTWESAMSPIHVSDDILVLEGVTLTVEPGVIVEVDPDKQIQVQGKIVADGTQEDPILFRSKNPAQRWSRIFLDDADSESRFTNCRITTAQTALQIRNTRPSNPITIMDCFLSANDHGIHITNANPSIIGNIVETFADAGIFIAVNNTYKLTPVISQSVISKRGAVGNSGITFRFSDAIVNGALATVSNCRIVGYSNGINAHANRCIVEITSYGCNLYDNQSSLHLSTSFDSSASFPTGTMNAEIRNNWLDSISFGTAHRGAVQAINNYWVEEDLEARSSHPSRIEFIDDAEENPFPTADINGDGVTDAADASLLLAYLVGAVAYEDLPNPEAADADGDGVIDIRDAALISAYARGHLWTLPRP